jgi:hypothetical protein
MLTFSEGEDIGDYSMEKFLFFPIFWEKTRFFPQEIFLGNRLWEKIECFDKKFDCLGKSSIFGKKSDFLE